MIQDEAKKCRYCMEWLNDSPNSELEKPLSEKRGKYRFPPLSLLDPGKPAERIHKAELDGNKIRIEEALGQFGVKGKVREHHQGPVFVT